MPDQPKPDTPAEQPAAATTGQAGAAAGQAGAAAAPETASTSPAVAPTGPVAPPFITPQPDTGYTAAGVPTFEGVREKIETRYGTALGATELAGETPEVRSASERYEAVQKAAANKLEEIRSSLREKD